MFVGKDGIGAEMPEFTEENYISDGDDLEAAIDKLDIQLKDTTDMATDATNEIAYIQQFIGKDADGAETPTYSSVNHITQNEDLEHVIGELDAALALSANSAAVVDGDTTPTVQDGGSNWIGVLTTANTGATTITDFDNGSQGQFLLVVFGDSNTAIQHGANIHLAGDTNMTAATDDSILLYNNGSKWIEVARQQLGGGGIPVGISTLDGSATPDVSNYETWQTDTTSSVTITNFINAQAGQEIKIIFKNDTTTIQDNANITLQGGADFFPQTNDTMKLVYDGSEWFEVARSVNS